MARHSLFAMVALAIFLFASALQCSPASAQTINDPAQGEKYGIWKVMNPEYPGIQTRARCDVDLELNGRMHSEWYYQVRSTYKGTVDYAYLVEFDSPLSHVNEMTGPFLATAKPGDVTEGFTGLFGICGEHATVKTGLHIQIGCAVPTGQDAPCFKNSNGNLILSKDPAQSMPRGSLAPHAGSKYGGNAASKPVLRNSDGNSYPPRPDGAYSGNHNPESSPILSKTSGGKYSLVNSVWICNDSGSSNGANSGAKQETDTVTFGDGGKFKYTSDGVESGQDGIDRWTQTGNEVSWTLGLYTLKFSGRVIGNSMAVRIEGAGAGVSPTMSCQRK
jgi:hypothetical protein